MANIRSAAIAVIVMALFCACIALFMLAAAKGAGAPLYGTRKIETLKIISVNGY